jgi:hypothetical protein
MELDAIKGTYDIAISLGGPCQVAEQLRRHNLRTCAGPLDWTVLDSTPHLIKAINNRFDGYFNWDHLDIRGKHEHNRLVFENEYHCLSVHDFLWDEDPQSVRDQYPAFIERMQRRINRFYEKAKPGVRALFVRLHAMSKRLGSCKNVYEIW